MDALILWFIEANIAFVALYLFYLLFLHKDTFFKEKRVLFLCGFLFAILYPLPDLSSWMQKSHQISAFAQSLSISLPEIVVTNKQQTGLETGNIITVMYLTMTTFLFLRLLRQAGIVLNLAIRGQRVKLYDQTIILLPEGSAPFSFFGWIFVHPEEYCTQDLKEILQHERIHVRQCHTVDVLLTEVIGALFWINPCVWLLKRAVRENLEFLADRNVILSGFDLKSYQYNLLRLSYQQPLSTVGNHFKFSQLKNRIMMMNKKETSWTGRMKYTLTIPVIALLFFAANANASKAKQGTTGVAPERKPSTSVTKETNGINKEEEKPFLAVEQMPQFPGGEAELMKFIGKHLRYPAVARRQGIEGRVVIRFVVSKTGEVTNIEVIRGLDPTCDKEAIRVIKMMPKWKPGKQNGRIVAVYFTLPILYKISK